MKYAIVLLLMVAVSANDSLKCKRELIESHNMISFIQPNKAKLVLCPNVRQSCCPAFEQFKMFEKYNEILKHYNLINDVVKVELRMLSELSEKAVDSMLSKVSSITDEGARIQAIDQLQRLKKKNMKKIFRTAIDEHSNAHRYLLNMKTAYFCVICDYANHSFIDTVRKRYAMTDTSCDDLVRNTIVYSNAINRGVVSFIESLATVHQKISKKEKTLRLAGSAHLSKAIKECADEFKINDENLTSCKKYCSYFRLNGDSPAYEGYPEFFANALYELKEYGPVSSGSAAAAPAAPTAPAAPATTPPKSRLLAEKMEELLKSRRRLEESGSSNEFKDPFDPDALMPIDLFESMSLDPDFDDAAMIEAFKIQQNLTKGESFDPVSIIRRNYINEYNVEMDDIESPNVFNIPSQARVDVSEYLGEVLVAGIDYTNIMKNLNWNMTIDEITKALVTGKRASSKETIDPTLVIAMNEIDNYYVRNFHSHVIMNFKPMRFESRIKELKRRGADALAIEKKTVDETLAVVKSVMDENQISSDTGDKVIQGAKAKLTAKQEEAAAQQKPADGTSTGGATTTPSTTTDPNAPAPTTTPTTTPTPPAA